ncbi:unnamed protein product [Dracunculus medinensis]|uniref:Ribosomal RNA-processing protein 42 n=1 Tax=Dracunculus medinensis TaxID=318479 RepID=A0A0N4ULY5_DRAME|nr:unnamed protein product [Dracunculus medinensis]
MELWTVFDRTDVAKAKLNDYRPIIIETGVLSATNGSARVRLASTDLLIGVKAELAVIDNMSAYKNCINFYVDCSANATPLFEGKGGQEFGEEIASALYAAYDNSFAISDLSKLIVSSMHAWKLYVDIVVLQCGGNVIDAAGLGCNYYFFMFNIVSKPKSIFQVKAALFDTQICEVITRPDDEGKITVDLPEDIVLWKLDVSRAPLFVGVNKLGSANVVDLSLQEQACCRAALWIAVSPMISLEEQASSEDGDYRILFIRQCGGGSLQSDTLADIVSFGIQIGMRLQHLLARYLLVSMEDF